MDPRYQKLAELLVGYATKVQPGEHVLLQTDLSTPFDMNLAVIEAVRQAGGVLLNPMIWDPRLQAAARVGCTEQSLAVDANAYLATIRGTVVRIAIRGYINPLELRSVPPDDAQRFDRHFYAVVIEEAVEKTRWVLTEWPTTGFALMCGMSTSQAEEFFFRAVLADYPAMEQRVKPLQELMDRTKYVRIVGPFDTDLSFSIEGIPSVPCVGHRNIPDGECYTAPVRDSMQGVVQYNTVTITKNGEKFEGVRFVVKDGKIIKASCRAGNLERLQKMLDTDEGARYFGEWSLGLNWGVTETIGDTLFDEKVGGTFHLTPGKAYKDADNGNKSGVHWDIVCDQREHAGGGELWFDGQLVRKNGLFVIEELADLNPEPLAVSVG